MYIGKGNRKFSEKTCLNATFVHHKIPHEQTRDLTRAAAVWSRRLTAWAMARLLNQRNENIRDFSYIWVAISRWLQWIWLIDLKDKQKIRE
jgi:hypothetical protein